MTRILRCILALTFMVSVGLYVFAQDASKKKVAVYMTGKDINEAYKKVIGAKLVSAITESGEYAAVERTADFLAALSAENDYQTSGEVRDSQIAALGQKFGVQFVTVADVSEVFNEYFIAARMINVETGLVERAFDTNGPAESMSQLVDLSKKIASGLLNGVVSSAAPTHLSLCVVDKNGKTLYITAEQWKNTSETNKFNYTKKGVVIAENGMSFIVAMNDAGVGDWEWASRNYVLPSEWQFEQIYKHKKSLQNALRIYGGQTLNENGQDSGYWGADSYPYTWHSTHTIKALKFFMCDGSHGYHRIDYGTCERVRAIVKVDADSRVIND